MEIILTIIAVAGTLIGAFGGAYLTHRLERSQRKQDFLLVAKKENYAKLIGYGRNLILSDHSVDDHKMLHRLASESLLVCDSDISQKVRDFANNLDEFLPVKSMISSSEILTELKELEEALKHDLKI